MTESLRKGKWSTGEHPPLHPQPVHVTPQQVPVILNHSHIHIHRQTEPLRLGFDREPNPLAHNPNVVNKIRTLVTPFRSGSPNPPPPSRALDRNIPAPHPIQPPPQIYSSEWGTPSPAHFFQEPGPHGSVLIGEAISPPPSRATNPGL